MRVIGLPLWFNTPMFECMVEDHFSAAHHLLNYEGPCARPHGHNYRVQVFVASQALDRTNIAVDFRDMKQTLAEVLDQVDHYDLNTLPMFCDESPSAELIARWLYDTLKPTFPQLSKIRVYETPTQSVTYWPS